MSAEGGVGAKNDPEISDLHTCTAGGSSHSLSWGHMEEVQDQALRIPHLVLSIREGACKESGKKHPETGGEPGMTNAATTPGKRGSIFSGTRILGSVGFFKMV